MSGAAFSFDRPGPAVLLLHGFTGTPYELRYLAECMAARGIASAAPLLPGHGTHPRELSRMRWSDFRAAARAAFEALTRRHGAVFVGGLSMGALLALDLATDPATAGRVRGVLAFATALRFSARDTRVLAALRALGDCMPDVYLPKGGVDVQDPAIARATPAYPVQPLRAARELLGAQEAVGGALGRLRVPLLAVHGLRDHTCPLEGSVDLVARAGPTADATLLVFPRSGHLVTVDYDRADVARQSAAFVTRLA